MLTNCAVFHGLDHPVLFLASIRAQFHSRCNRIDSVSATSGVELTQLLVTQLMNFTLIA